MPWVHLALAAVFEIIFASSMKASDGFRRPWFAALTVVSVACGMWFLGLALRSLPVSAAYPIWVGVGAIGTVVIGVGWFGEPMSPVKAASVLAIVLGVVGLRMTTGASGPPPPTATASNGAATASDEIPSGSSARLGG